MDLCDVLMIGSLGVEHLAAVAFANGILIVPQAMIMGLSSAIAMRISRLSSSSPDYREASRNVVFAGIGLCVVTAACFCLGLWILGGSLSLFGQEQAVVRLSREYFYCGALSLIPMALFNSCKQVSDGKGNTRAGGCALLLHVLCTLGINYLLIFGAGSIPSLGIKGAALGNLVSRCLLAICYAWFLRWAYPEIFAGIKRLRVKTLRQEIPGLLALGGPTSMQMLFEMGIFSVAALTAGTLGAQYLATHEVVVKCISTAFMLPFSLSIAASIRVSQALGSGMAHRAKEIGLTTLALALLVLLATSSGLFLGRFYLPEFLTHGNVKGEVVADIFALASLFHLFDGVQIVTLGILRGFFDTKLPSMITFVAYWLICFPVALIGRFIGLSGAEGLWCLWIGLMLGFAGAAVLLVLRFIYLCRE